MATATLDEVKIVISADTQSAIENIDKVGSALEKINKSNSGNSSSFEKVNNVIKKIDRSLSSALNKISKYAGQAFKENNDYVEAVNLFTVTMGKGTKSAQQYANTLQELMGIDSKEWMSYQGSLNQMLVGFGTTEKEANNMSQQLTQIAYDLSSVWNVDVSEAFHKIQSGMSGQVKGLKTWGINLSVAQLKETALAHGITLSTAKMTEQQKATLRYVTIMEKTKNVQNDLARTIISPANAMRVLQNQLLLLKRALGQLVSIVVTKYIPIIQLVTQELTKAAQSLANFFGYKLPDIDYDNMESLSAVTDSLADSLADSNENAKELKRTLAGFDEINQLADNTVGTSNVDSTLGGGLPGDLGIDLSQYDYDFTKGLDTTKLDQFKNKLKDILWYVSIIGAGILAWKFGSALSGANLITTSFKQLFGVVLAVSGALLLIKGSIDGIVNGIDWQNAIEMLAGAAGLIGGLALAFGSTGAAIGGIVSGVIIAITGIIDAVKNGINTINAIVTAAGTTIIGTTIGAMIGGPFGALIGAAIGLVVGGIADLVIYISQNKEKVIDMFNDVGDWVQEKIIDPITDKISMFFEIIKNKLSPITDFVKQVIGNISTVIGDILEPIKEWIEVIYDNVSEILNGISSAVGTVAQKIVEIVNTIWQIIKAVVGYIWNEIVVYIDMLKNNIAKILEIVKVAINVVRDSIAVLIEKIKTFISPIVEWLNDKILSPIKNFVTSAINFVFDKIDKLINAVKNIAITVANGVGNIIKKALNGIFGIAEDIINFFIRGLNNVVGVVNKLPGVSISKVAPIKIDKFESGGVIDSGSLFIANEAGPELIGNIGRRSAVANTTQMKEVMKQGAYEGMVQALKEQGGKTSYVVLEIDGERLTKKVIKKHNELVKQTGSSPLLVGG